MKLKSLFLIPVLLLVFACDSYPQQVPIKVTYKTPAAVDSCQLVVEKNLVLSQLTFVDSAVYNSQQIVGKEFIKFRLIQLRRILLLTPLLPENGLRSL